MTGEHNRQAETSLDSAIKLFRIIAHKELACAEGDFDSINWLRVVAEFFVNVKADEQSALSVFGTYRLTDVIRDIFSEMRNNCSQSSASLH